MVVSRDLQHEVEQFLFHEAELLENRRFEEWLELLTRDVIYWVPNIRDDSDISDEAMISYEGYDELRARTVRLRHPLNPTQKPPPRTRHFITNVSAEAGEGGELRVRCNLLVYVSKDGKVVHHPGTSEYRLREEDGSWRIASKKVYLITNDLPLTPLPIM
ncbi:MAG: aromatic-ring-hydroxylating dioxygenase subunit beta [Chloroflexota bacterium]|nr:aromatic-ring-hydroxylating dioxygenase subunit beta [Chloroflexota bacterium]MDE2886092.1 aromatic-ring-hydroxylating dioxygenase subunit beta [Chloroflexota bacterium]